MACEYRASRRRSNPLYLHRLAARRSLYRAGKKKQKWLVGDLSAGLSPPPARR
jgi:hypothetical protein